MDTCPYFYKFPLYAARLVIKAAPLKTKRFTLELQICIKNPSENTLKTSSQAAPDGKQVISITAEGKSERDERQDS